MTLATAAAFLSYFLVIAGVSYASLRRTHDLDDYAIGGRSLTPTVAALSAGASDMSGWLLLGLPGAVFVAGLSESWILPGLVVGAWCNWTLIAPRLRTFSEALDGARTLPQLFARRMGGTHNGLRIIATIIVLGFFALYTASGFVAGAKLFSLTIELDYHVALWLGVAVIMVYTAMGGFLAVSWTDCFQALLMVAALVVVPALVLADIGADAVAIPMGTIGTLSLVSLLAWGLGYLGQPHILARFMAIESASMIPRARRIGMSWMIVSSIGAVSVGIWGAQYFSASGMELKDPETVFIALSQIVLNPYVAGIVIAAILAAVMSTVDSQLLVASTALVEDVLRPDERGISDSQSMLISRGTVVLIALLAGSIASDPESQVLGMVAYAWAGLGASFGPALLFALFWRNTTSAGLIAGMVTGALVVVGWRALEGGLFDVYELLPAFVLACLAIFLVSLLDGAKDSPRNVFDNLVRGA